MRMQKGEAYNHLWVEHFELRFISYDVNGYTYDFSIVHKESGLSLSWEGFSRSEKYFYITRLINLLQSLGYRTYSNFNDALFTNVKEIEVGKYEDYYRFKKLQR